MFKIFIVNFMVIMAILLTGCISQEKPPVVIENASDAVIFKSKDTSTFIKAMVVNEGEKSDMYDNAQDLMIEIYQNVLETIVFYKQENPADFVGMLARDWTISNDGLTYTFNIRSKITFHNGNELTPSDVSYSLQRAFLRPTGEPPLPLIGEPILGIGIADVTYLLDPTGGLVNLTKVQLKQEDAGILSEICQKITNAIVADDATGKVTITLKQPYSALLGILANYRFSIVDKQWAIEHGAWDGSCDTWQNYFISSVEIDPLLKIANGTGPFILNSWDQKSNTINLKRNDNYWRSESLWDGAHIGIASLKEVLIKGVGDWASLIAMFQNGDADQIIVPSTNLSQIDPLVGLHIDYDPTTGLAKKPQLVIVDQPVALNSGLPSRSRTDILMNEDIKLDKDYQNTFIGIGSTTNGSGIPTNFFKDLHVRKALNYCMDWDSFSRDMMMGDTIRLPYMLTLPGELGFDLNGPTYKYSLDLCAEEFKAAGVKDLEGNSLWETGFYFIAVIKQGDEFQKSMLEILKNNFSKVNPKFKIEVIQMPWEELNRYYQNRQLPIYPISWEEEIHDPHNWYIPYIKGVYSQESAIDASTIVEWTDYVNRGIMETDPVRRAEIYRELNTRIYEFAPYIIGPVNLKRVYVQRYVNGWYYNLLYGGNYYYELSKN